MTPFKQFMVFRLVDVVLLAGFVLVWALQPVFKLMRERQKKKI